MATERRRFFPLYTSLYREPWPREWKLALAMLGMLMTDRWAGDRLTDEQATRARLSEADLLEVTGCPDASQATRMLRGISREVSFKIKRFRNGYCEIHWPKFLNSLVSRRPLGAQPTPAQCPADPPSSTSTSTSTKKKREPKHSESSVGAAQFPDALQFAEDFRVALELANPDFKAPTPSAFAGWVTQARLLIEERGLERAREVARWLFDKSAPSKDAEFWRGVIFGVPKFREKFDQLAAKQRSHNGRSPSTAGTSTSDLAERARAILRDQGLSGPQTHGR